jgi:hypothetical protein
MADDNLTPPLGGDLTITNCHWQVGTADRDTLMQALLNERASLYQILQQRNALLAALKAVIANHCGNEALFCSTCTPARAAIAKAEAQP